MGITSIPSLKKTLDMRDFTVDYLLSCQCYMLLEHLTRFCKCGKNVFDLTCWNICNMHYIK